MPVKNLPEAIVNTKIANINNEHIKSVYEYYKNDEEFRDVDFVICSFWPAQCELFIPLNKTIIFNPTHRYNLGRCTPKRWSKLNSNLYMLREKSKLIVSSMSVYDREYTGYFTGLFGYRLFSYGGFYARGFDFNPTKNTILIGPSMMEDYARGSIDKLNEYSKKNNYSYEFKHIRKVYKRYTLDQLANHRAIILFPYAVMSYSITDFYASKIPLFVPSPKIWKNIPQRSVRQKIYCGRFFPNGLVPETPFNGTLHKFSPNDGKYDAYQYWMSFADYYQWPYVTVYESLKDLFDKLISSDYQKISDNMKSFNKIREADLLDNWCKILKTKDTQATIPKSFDEALKYFGTNEFQTKPNTK